MGSKSSTMKPETKTNIEDLIASKKVFIISKTWCGFCQKAKKTLQSHIGKEIGADDLVVMEIDDHAEEDAIQDYMAKKTGARSVPRVFINGKCIGGGDDTAQLEASDKLGALLAA